METAAMTRTATPAGAPGWMREWWREREYALGQSPSGEDAEAKARVVQSKRGRTEGDTVQAGLGRRGTPPALPVTNPWWPQRGVGRTGGRACATRRPARPPRWRPRVV